MNDSRVSESRPVHAETNLHDLQLSTLAKKTALRDLQNDNRMTVPRSMDSCIVSKDSGSKPEYAMVTGTKMPTTECVVKPSTSANGHLVYVRRRPDVEVQKSGIFGKTNDNNCSPQRKTLVEEDRQQDKTTEKNSLVKEPELCISQPAPTSGATLLCAPSEKPSVSSLVKSNNISQAAPTSGAPLLCSPSEKPSVPSLVKSNNISQSKDSNHLPVPPPNNEKKMNEQLWEERYSQLQDLLKRLDQTNKADYIQMLHTLSSVELSRHAVELEKRAIHLSLVEAKELQRVRMLDVLGKYSNSNNSRVPSSQQAAQ